MSVPGNALTFVTAACSLAKRTVVIDGIVTRTDDPPWSRIVTFETVELDNPDDLLEVLSAAADYDPAPCIVRADPLAEMGRRAIYDDPEKGPAGMRVMPRAWVGYDIEKVPAAGIDPLCEPERAVARVRRCLPPAHHDTSVVWQITASAGKRRDELRLRLWFLLDKPLLGRQIETWCKPGIDTGWLDPCTLRNEVLPHFIAVKLIGNSPDPCPQRWGIIHGERDRVPVPDHVAAAPVYNRGRSTDEPIGGGNPEELRRYYGPRLEARRREASDQIREAIEAVRAATKGARHPTYLRAAATIAGLCKYWCFASERPRAMLEETYLSTLTPDEARKRDQGSTRGVWSWVAARTPRQSASTRLPRCWPSSLARGGLVMADPNFGDLYPAAEPRKLTLSDYGATRFTGPPPQIKWLVQHSIPLGVPVLLAAMGGVGKSFLTLQLCHLVATPAIENPGIDGMIHNLNTYTRPLLGGTVVEHGKAVFISAEDGDDTIHRRLALVDPHGRRTDDLIIVGLPSAGGPMPFFVQDRDGVRTTDEWHMVRDQLLSTTALKLIAIDPIAAFAQVSLDSDSAAVQFVMSAFSQLAAETGATVLLSHHMRKADNGKPPQTPAEAREQIKGVTQLVDGARLAYAIWPVEEAEGRKVCNDLEILPCDPNRVFKGGIVKTNELGGKISTYVRADDGLLLDRTADLRRSRPGQDEYRNLLVEDLAAYAADMMPLQKTGNSGVHEQRECLHPNLRSTPRDHLRALCQELIDAGRIVKCRAKGSTSAVWLDMPDGPFAQANGNVEIRTGARTKRHSDGS